MEPTNPAKSEDWSKFKREILEIAATFAEVNKCEGSYRKPKDVVLDLEKIETALTVALQTLCSLQLEHEEGQAISSLPFNWPVVQALDHGRAVIDALQGNVAGEIPAYPTELIKGLRKLREAARKAIEMEKPGRGNSTRRNPSSARRADLAKNLVFRYRSRFGHMPPMSHTGPVIDLMREMLIAAGEKCYAEDELLRQAIIKDEAGRALLPNARTAKSVKRAK